MSDKQRHEAGPDAETAAAHARVLAHLLQEVFQTERSAQLHCEREAARLGDSPPAHAMRVCSEHAEQAVIDLRAVAKQDRLATGGIGRLIGRALSVLRNRLVDRLIAEERSYRGTLLGLRHGVDAVRMLQHTADASGDVDVSGFCTRWLAEREPLVEEVARSMTWFARHPEVAIDDPGHAAATVAAATTPMR